MNLITEFLKHDPTLRDVVLVSRKQGADILAKAIFDSGLMTKYDIKEILQAKETQKALEQII